MELLYGIFVDPFVLMYDMPDFLLQVLWEGFVSGVLYALIALGFVLIFKASGVFNFAQGIMVVFAALALVGIYSIGVSGQLSLVIFFVLAIAGIYLKSVVGPAAFSGTVSGQYLKLAWIPVLLVSLAIIAKFGGFDGLQGVIDALIGDGLKESGLSAVFGAIGAVLLTLVLMYLLAFSVERLMLRQLVGQPDIILFMSTIGLTFILIGAGEWIFGGETKSMITAELYLPSGDYVWEVFGGLVIFQKLDIAAAAIAGLLIAGLAVFFSITRIGRALRAVADDHQAALSVGISLNQIWVVVWFAAGIVALVTGIMWGAKSDVSFALQIVALKALPVLVLGGFTSVPGAIVGGLIIGIGEKLFEIYWGGPLLGGGVESWFAFIIALIFLLFRPQGIFGEKIIERV